MGLRDEFVKAASVPHKDVEVNGTTVRVTGLTADMQLRLADSDDMTAGEVTFWVLEHCLKDPTTGERLFGDNDQALKDLSGDVLADLAKEAMGLSGIAEAAKN